MPGWDPSLVDPTETPADALIIRSPGGRTGNLSLENGQVLSFPWKRQQQVAGTRAGNIRVYDNVDTEFLNIQAPTLTPSGDLAYIYLAGWADGTASIVIDNGTQSIALGNDIISVDGGKAFFNAGIDVAGGFSDFRSDAGEDIQLISGGKIRLEATEEIRLTGDAGIVIVNDSVTGTDITIQTNQDLWLNVDRDCLLTTTTGDFSVNTGDAINLLADGIWLGEGSSATLQALSGGDVNLTAIGVGGNVNLSAVDAINIVSSGGAVFVQASSDVSLIGSAGTLSVNTLLSAWTTFTPTVSGTGTAIGNGQAFGRYRRVGKTLDIRYRIILGTTSTVGSGGLNLSLPAGMAALTETDGFQYISGMFRDTGTFEYKGTGRIASAGTSFLCQAEDTSTAASILTATSATFPHTWASTDVVVLNGTIEIA